MDDKCNHKIKSKKTTLHLLGRVFMTYPNIRHAVCMVCGKEFKFTEDEKGELKPVKKSKEGVKNE